jgi:hypothetical protein
MSCRLWILKDAAYVVKKPVSEEVFTGKQIVHITKPVFTSGNLKGKHHLRDLGFANSMKRSPS